MKCKSVFISYRRTTGGAAMVDRLRDKLTVRGYDVFVDVSSLGPGPWPENLDKEVRSRKHFLLLLAPGIWDSSGPVDWVRSEFNAAIAAKRNVVPVVVDFSDVQQALAGCPPDMDPVRTLEAAEVRPGFPEGDVNELVRRFLAPLDGLLCKLTHWPPSPLRLLSVFLALALSTYVALLAYYQRGNTPVTSNQKAGFAIISAGLVLLLFSAARLARWASQRVAAYRGRRLPEASYSLLEGPSQPPVESAPSDKEPSRTE